MLPLAFSVIIPLINNRRIYTRPDQLDQLFRIILMNRLNSPFATHLLYYRMFYFWEKRVSHKRLWFANSLDEFENTSVCDRVLFLRKRVMSFLESRSRKNRCLFLCYIVQQWKFYVPSVHRKFTTNKESIRVRSHWTIAMLLALALAMSK